jgi:dipeptidyl aminopeptidase/acylaminoacyl peptidase
MRNCTRRIFVLLIVVVFFGKSQSMLADARRSFTTKDSIEMTTFSDPYTRLSDAECKKSRDGKHFFTITTRGILRTNELESTLWVYSAFEVQRYLHEQGGLAPKPRMLFRIKGTPVARQTNSYGSLITKAQWASDSMSILSLVEQPDGYRHISRTYVDGRRSIDLTRGDTDITDFSEAGDTIAYLVAEHMSPAKVIGQPMDEVSSDLTGLSFFHVFFPKTFPDSSSLQSGVDLWVLSEGVNKRLNVGGTWHFPASAAGLQISVSPNGRALIAAQPVPDVPADWSKYETASNTLSFIPASTGADRSGKGFNWPWRYIYVDLDKWTTTPLVDAPSGFLTGYIDVLQAVWSPDSQYVLFTNSYFPLHKPSGKQPSEELSACAAGVYGVADHEASCIEYARFPKENESLRSATFGTSSNEAILQWSGEGKEETEVHERTGNGWELESRKKAIVQRESQFKIFIRQDISQPPTLWAAEANKDLAKRLWDPNPQLASLQLGQASIYTWRDSTGYEWRAGLVLPPDFVRGHRYPLVIQTHGFYNEHEFLVDGSFTTGFAARPLAAAGIVVLQMEDRSDRHIRPAQEEPLLAVEGFESAIDHLDKDGVIDHSRVGIIGFSRSAWYVEEALIHAPHRFRAATLIDGTDQSYLTYMLFAPGSPETAVEGEAANGGRPFGSGIQPWVKNAAGFNLDKLRTPVRIEALGMISVLGEWELYSSLFQQGKPVDFVYIPNGQHILQKPKERYASQQENVDWFRFWLQGYIDSSSAKAVQYHRWTQLPFSNELLVNSDERDK